MHSGGAGTQQGRAALVRLDAESLALNASPGGAADLLAATLDALKLVRLRARLMEDAYPRGYGMLAVLGLNESEIARAIADSGADACIGNRLGQRCRTRASPRHRAVARRAPCAVQNDYA
jgi:malonate decarboxylase epsilon subunit